MYNLNSIKTTPQARLEEKFILMKVKYLLTELEENGTDGGGSVVTHETRIWEVPRSNPVTGQPG